MKNKILKLILPVLFLYVGHIQAQTTVNSLEKLLPYLKVDNANVKLAPGTYSITATDIANETFGETTWDDVIALLIFEGDNSTFDFTDVTLNIDTAVLSSFGNVSVRELSITGNNNVLKNLTMVDIGSVNDAPGNSAVNITIDGQNNRIEGFHCSIKGSTPYGYGDIFGKGGTNTIIGHKKHSACLIRGSSNSLINSTFIHRAYGHGIFFQGANDPHVEGCYVQGELSTVAKVLAEKGTDSKADNVDFLTTWGFYLTDLIENYRFSLQEDGIRAYNGGKTIINGVEYERGVTGATVIDCTVEKMRSGVTIGWAGGTKYVENCTTLACENGYWVGSNAQIVNSSGDASIGPLLSEDVRRSNSTIDLTLLDNHVSKIGNTPTVYYAGSDHNVTLKDGTTSFDSGMKILLGGKRLGHRWIAGSVQDPPYFSATNINFNNQTKYPIVLGDNATNNDITTCGPVTDNGSSNTISNSTTCDYDRPCDNRADNLQAECYDTMDGIGIRDITGNLNEREVFAIDSGNWISFNNIDLTNMASIEVIASGEKNDVSLEVRQGSQTGTLLATIPISSTGGYLNYQEFSANLNQNLTGLNDVYFVANTSSQSGWLFNLDVLRFIKDPCTNNTTRVYSPIGAENFCEDSGVIVQDLSVFNQIVGEIKNNDYIKFSNVDFGIDDTYFSLDILASSANSGGTIEVRTNTIDGDLLSKVSINNTGGWDQYDIFSANISNQIIGVHDLYFVFKGSSGFLFNIDWFKFNYNTVVGENLALASNGSVASQSSTAFGADASRANDGNTDGNYNNGSVSHTENGDEGVLKWWQVDLGANKTIHEIVIFNRTGSNYGERLNSFTVEVIKSNGEITFSKFFESHPNPSISINTDTTIGQVIKISKTSNRALTIAEVEVYGSNSLSVNDNKFDQIKFYPNPAQDILTINNAFDTTLEIYNIQGVLKLTVKLSENKKSISLDNLNFGIHFLKFTSNQGTIVKKLIKL